MDLFSTSTSRRSSNFIQTVMDDGVLDYSADWDIFSFETELDSRKKILEEDWKAYHKLLDQLFPDNSSDLGESTINELQNNKETCHALLLTNEDIFSKYKILMEEHKTIKDDLEKSTLKNNSLEKTIENLRKEKVTSRTSYHQQKLALQKAKEMYTTYFGINVSTKSLSDTRYEASLYFTERDGIAPIKFIVDRVNRKIIDFQPNGVLLPKEEEEIRKEFGTLENLPGLFCALHDIVVKR